MDKGEAMWTMGTLGRGLNLLAKVEEGKEITPCVLISTI